VLSMNLVGMTSKSSQISSPQKEENKWDDVEVIPTTLLGQFVVRKLVATKFPDIESTRLIQSFRIEGFGHINLGYCPVTSRDPGLSDQISFGDKLENVQVSMSTLSQIISN